MTKTRISNIYSKAIFSEDETHRYILERIWDENKSKATVIMINPSYADHIKGDNSTTKVMNYLVDCKLNLGENRIIEFGGIKVVNIFSYIETDSKEIKVSQNDNLYDKNTSDKMKKSFDDSEVIIVAWGKDKSKYKLRKKEIRKILNDRYKSKVFYFVNKDDTPAKHPSKIKNEFKIAKYNFEVEAI